MAVFFEDSSSSGSLPFVNDYVTDQAKFKSEVFYVDNIRPSKKQTGLLLTTDKCIVFLFKNSKPAKRVIEICERYQDTHYYPLIVKTTSQDPFYQIGLDDESECEYMVKKDDFYGLTSWDLGKAIKGSVPTNSQSPHIPAKENQPKK